MPEISRFFGIVRIRAVEPLEGFRLRLHLTNDAVIERDVRPLMNGQIFEELIWS